MADDTLRRCATIPCMGSFLLVSAVVLVVAALVVGVVALISGEDPGMANAEPDDRAVPLPTDRPLAESDLAGVRFDIGLRGYRMDQVDRALRRTAYDLGYKEEMIGVLEAEVAALREGRADEAERLRRARVDSTAGREPVDREPVDREPDRPAEPHPALEAPASDDGHRARG